MPETTVVFYREESGQSEVLDWLRDLRQKNPKAFAVCRDRVKRLMALGHELRRPTADYLRDGIYELRARERKVQYRLLYFFHGKNVAIIAHGLTKEKTVPAIDIDRAIERRKRYEQDPTKHTAQEEIW